MNRAEQFLSFFPADDCHLSVSLIACLHLRCFHLLPSLPSAIGSTCHVETSTDRSNGSNDFKRLVGARAPDNPDSRYNRGRSGAFSTCNSSASSFVEALCVGAVHCSHCRPWDLPWRPPHRRATWTVAAGSRGGRGTFYPSRTACT